MIPPGQTIGIVGGGQLGRMLAMSAQALGYRVHGYDPSADCPAASVCHRFVAAEYEDEAALGEFAAGVQVLTYEFENIPAGPLAAAARRAPLRPAAEVLQVCQNRQREKAWLKAHGIPHALSAEALGGDIRLAVAEVGLPCVVKTADFGYDGKGQMRIGGPDELEQAAAIFRGRRCVLERWIDFAAEFSVIVARSDRGEERAFPAAENIHSRHILDYTLVPARLPADTTHRAEALALRIARELGVVGLLAVEFFALSDGEVLVNELAPRPHNSGHWSLDGAVTSQFEQHVRAICGLPLGSSVARGPIVMANLLGDLWAAGEPDWSGLLAEPTARLHLYGKREARAGRKMGHFTVSASTVDEALARARSIRERLAT